MVFLTLNPRSGSYKNGRLVVEAMEIIMGPLSNNFIEAYKVFLLSRIILRLCLSICVNKI